VGISLIAFALIRIKNNPHILKRRSRFYGSHVDAAYITLLMIFGIISTLLLLNASRHALGELPYPNGALLSRSLGNFFASHVSRGTLGTIEYLVLLAHEAVFFGFLIFLVHSKHLHIITSLPNVLFGRHPLALG